MKERGRCSGRLLTPTASMCQSGIFADPLTGKEPQMQRTTIGLDIAKRVFQAHAVDPASGAVTRTKLQRAEVLPYVAQLQPSLIVMEACGAAQHWAREFAKLGHEVKLIAPQFVRPFVKMEWTHPAFLGGTAMKRRTNCKGRLLSQTASKCQSGGLDVPLDGKEPRMKPTTIGLDIAKHVFQAHAVDSITGEVTRTKLRRSEVLSHFAQLQPSVIVMEACGSSQHWARELAKIGHEVKLIAQVIWSVETASGEYCVGASFAKPIGYSDLQSLSRM